MRERPDSYVTGSGTTRITPARAGKTRKGRENSAPNEDHPRSCGKDQGYAGRPHPSPGSPPLVRERQAYVDDQINLSGITPARAGKTGRHRYTNRRPGDHPRSCGKDSNGFLYFRPFTLTDVQNLFNFFAKHLTSSASPNAR